MKTTLIIVVVLLAAASAGLAVACAGQAREPQQDAVVIGREGARAAEAEARRKARGPSGPSPMPAGEYGFEAEELGLVNPRPNALDAALADLSRRYAQADDAERARMRDAISMEEFYTLLDFARRASVFGLRERQGGRLAAGLTAVSMVEQERVDYRDILVALSLLHHSAARVGADPAKLFRDAARLAEPNTRQLILGFLARPQQEKSLRDAWGHDEVETEGGVGFIGYNFQPYHPTTDLKRVAVEFARLAAADQYTQVSASIASDLPSYWLEGVDDAALKRALGKVRAGANVHGLHKRGGQLPHDSESLMVFVVETADEAAARTLLDLARRHPPADYAMLPLAEGRLFCLVVARSFQQGVKPLETGEGLKRFATPMAEVLRRHAARPAKGTR
jgi:hypothetical protein